MGFHQFNLAANSIGSMRQKRSTKRVLKKAADVASPLLWHQIWRIVAGLLQSGHTPARKVDQMSGKAL